MFQLVIAHNFYFSTNTLFVYSRLYSSISLSDPILFFAMAAFGLPYEKELVKSLLDKVTYMYPCTPLRIVKLILADPSYAWPVLIYAT